MDCICSIVNSALQSEMLRLESLKALESAKTFTNCNVRECFEELQMPYSTNKEIPLEFFIFPIIAIGLFITHSQKSLK